MESNEASRSEWLGVIGAGLIAAVITAAAMPSFSEQVVPAANAATAQAATAQAAPDGTAGRAGTAAQVRQSR